MVFWGGLGSIVSNDLQTPSIFADFFQKSSNELTIDCQKNVQKFTKKFPNFWGLLGENELDGNIVIKKMIKNVLYITKTKKCQPALGNFFVPNLEQTS